MKLPDGSNGIKKLPSEQHVSIMFEWAKTLDFPECTISSTYPRIKLNDIISDKSRTLKSVFGKMGQVLLEKESEEDSEEEDESDSD